MLSIKAEGCPGDTIEEVAHDMIQLAKKLSVCVELKANGVILLAFPDTTVDSVVKQYRYYTQEEDLSGK